MTILLNLLCALIFFFLGRYYGFFQMTYYIIESPEAEIMAEVKKIKQIAKEGRVK